MNLSEGDTVSLPDGTKGIIAYVYSSEAVAVVDTKDGVISVPFSELTKESE